MRPIAILGTGPAGLLAAHACALEGKPLAIFGFGERSKIGGAQFLHSAIPGLTGAEPDTLIKYKVAGDAIGYRKKVYGLDPRSTPSWVSFQHREDGDLQPAWNLLEAYDKLWDNYSQSINTGVIDPEWIEKHSGDFKAIISTIPAPALCRSMAGLIPVTHEFISQEILVTDRSILQLEEGTVYYDGTGEHSWYRCSNLFGVGSTEWSTRVNPPYPGLQKILKPVRKSCDCYEDILRMGRYGAWNKGELTHDAYFRTRAALHAMY